MKSPRPEQGTKAKSLRGTTLIFAKQANTHCHGNGVGRQQLLRFSLCSSQGNFIVSVLRHFTVRRSLFQSGVATTFLVHRIYPDILPHRRRFLQYPQGGDIISENTKGGIRMFTVGVDLATVSRIKKSLENERFAKRVFSERELELFFDIDMPKYRSLRANFAAKEAFGKALGTGVKGFSLNEVSVLRNEAGAPYLEFTGRAAAIVLEGGYSCSVSLSHEGDRAVAVVLLEKTGNIKKLDL